jgi:ribosomal protein S18 acetylase RimI-like enzyme
VAEAPPRFAAFAAARLGAAGLALRPAADSDLATIAAIYATVREDELRQVPWTPEQKKAFTDSQSRQQESHYALHYPDAERLLIERGGATIGRIYVDTANAEVRLMEIALLTAHRNQGIGTRIVEEFLRYADTLARPSSLHVEPFNPAKRMYERMGFTVRETRGLYEFMVRPLPA